MIKKLEINAPAGTLEKLKFAINFGADAIYCSGVKFGLRKHAGNLSDEELCEAAKLCRAANVKLYVTLNIFAHNSDFFDIEKYIIFLSKININAVIISDPGVFLIVKKTAPELAVFISTQANTMNCYAAEFWRKQGVKRVILSRELSITEIAEIKKKVDIEIEVFAHGAVCISYSGRCFLSKYMSARDANDGECAHPCRWKYAVVEEKRPGQFFPIESSNEGSYIFNAKDLCCVSLIPDFINAGIDSLKIEGRMKSVYYTAAATAVYKNAINLYFQNPDDFNNKLNFYQSELNKISNRFYHTGFYTGIIPSNNDYNFAESRYYRDFDFIAIVVKGGIGESIIETRAKFLIEDELEILNPQLRIEKIKILNIQNEQNIDIQFANPNMKVMIRFTPDIEILYMSILRRKKKNEF